MSQTHEINEQESRTLSAPGENNEPITNGGGDPDPGCCTLPPDDDGGPDKG
jgi:hypothetical protein